LYASIYSTTISISLASSYWYQGQSTISYAFSVFIGTGNSIGYIFFQFLVLFFLNFMRWMFSYLYWFIWIFCKSSRRGKTEKRHVRDHEVVLSKIQGEILISFTVNLNALCFLKFRRNCGNAGIIYHFTMASKWAHLYRWS
jgi:hypothetical protein